MPLGDGGDVIAEQNGSDAAPVVAVRPPITPNSRASSVLPARIQADRAEGAFAAIAPHVPLNARPTVPTTADLPPLSTNVPCVKCGCAHATTRYEPARATPVSPGVLAQTPEHLARTCTRCGYTWRERPLDTVPGPGAAGDVGPTVVRRVTDPGSRPDA